MSGEILVSAENVSKKFCRSLRRSLWYGVKDVGSELVGRSNVEASLRKDEFWAVKDISFELRRGECLGLIGPNGAGKSTLLKMLNGLIKPDRGQINMRGRIGALIELGAGFNPILTGRENIYINGSILGFTRSEMDHRLDSIVEFAELEEFIDMPVQNYSSGMKVRLGFSVAAQLDPDVLLIDEVLAVGDVGFRHKGLNAVNKIMNKAAVIFVSHSMPQLSRVCTDIMVIDHGQSLLFEKEVDEGIEYYFDKFRGPSAMEVGSEKVKLVDFKINSDQGTDDELPTAKFKEPFFIELTFLLSGEISAYKINIGISDKELIPVAFLTSHPDGGYYLNTGQENRIKIEILSIPFSMGIYDMSIYFEEVTDSGKEGQIYARHLSIKQFKVPNGPHNYMPVLLQSRWEKHK
ncbi:MAG: polysaccharide ABC transporter ATP-binding protein [Anaerolineales bacterium]|jgi:lipopolysaccharide transport system ATP-binding protein